APAEVTPEPETQATAPEEAATEIVPEAAEQPSSAPDASTRPRTRPDRPAPTPTPTPTQTAEAPPERPAETPATPAAPEPQPSETTDSVAEALAQALAGGTTAPQPDVPTGPPMTSGEKDALRVAVQQCWVVDSGSLASNVTVTVAVELEQNGRVISNSIRMIGSDGGSGAAVDVAFQAARRALLRCQGDGYRMPPDKYGQWQNIEMTFDPDGMRMR
ncbi:hypothetical protein P775_23090, partial [Puniceibacterium antarcticum]